MMNLFHLLWLCATFQQLRAACPTAIQWVSPSGLIRASQHQSLTFTCGAKGSAVWWFANGRHVSEGANLALELVESDTVLLDSEQCLRQRNLTVVAMPLARIDLTCFVPGIEMPSSQIQLFAEGTAPVVIHIEEEGYQPGIALTNTEEVNNYMKLRWDPPYTSDDPQTLEYEVKLVHVESNSTIRHTEQNETELSIPAKELQQCCNYSVSVAAKTENFTAIMSYANIPCSKFPPAVNTNTIDMHLYWTKDMVVLLLTFTKIPEFSCPEQWPQNATVMATSLFTGKIMTATSPISPPSHIFQVNLTGLERRQTFKGIATLSNQVGYSTFNDMLSFTTFAVQELKTTIQGKRIEVTCTFMEGSQDGGCHITLTHTASGMEYAIDLYKNMNPSATVYVQQDGSYDISVDDMDDKGSIVAMKAWTTTIWVGSSNLQPTGPTVLPSSTTTFPQPSPTVNPNSSPWELWLLALLAIPIILLLLLVACCGLSLLQKPTKVLKLREAIATLWKDPIIK